MATIQTTIQTTIQVIDNISPVLSGINHAMQTVMSRYDSLRNAFSQALDTTGIEEAVMELSHAEGTANQLAESMNNIVTPIVESPPIPEQNWQSTGHIEIIDTTGIQRMKAELASLDQLSDNVIQSQRQIDDQALKMKVLPQDAVRDINLTNQRIEELGNKISALQGQDISLLDNSSAEQLNSDYEGLRLKMMEMINLQGSMNQSMAEGNISQLSADYNQLNTIAEQLEIKMRENAASIQELSTIQWQSDTTEIFTSQGTERYIQELSSAKQALSTLNITQQMISEQAAQTNIFPDNMISDLNHMQSRIQEIKIAIDKMEKQDMNFGSKGTSKELEQLRHQLSQAVGHQKDLNQAVKSMNVAQANQSYLKLSQIVGGTERHIRDNQEAQLKFNESIGQANQKFGAFVGKVKSIAGSLGINFDIKKVLDLSDSMASTKAQLGSINDGFKTNEQLQNMVFESAQRSRTAYMETASTVTKLGTNAKRAFSNNEEMVIFAEQMSKHLKIGCGSVKDQSSAMNVLTQAMAEGGLQGNKFSEVLKSAPMLAQAIADNMGQSVEQLSQMSSKGRISADVIKNAMFSSIDETNAKFAETPATFGQLATLFGDMLLQTFQPVLETISAGAQWIHDNWSILEPIFWGLTAAVGTYASILGIQAVAAWAAKIAQDGLNLAMLKNPIMWIAIAIGVIVGAIYTWVQSVGGLEIAWKIVVNTLLTTWDKLKIKFFEGIYFLCGLWDNLSLKFSEVGISIANTIGDMKVSVLMTLQNMVNGAIDIINEFINKINKIGIISIDTIAKVSFATNAKLENEAEKAARNKGLEDKRRDIQNNIAKRDEQLKKMEQDAKTAAEKKQAEIDKLKDQAEEKKNNSPDYNQQQNDKDSGQSGEDSPYNSASMDNSITADEEVIQYLRDIAEQEAINRFTTAEIKVDLGGVTNNVNQDADLDGMMTYLEEQLFETMTVTAEGVY